MATPTQTPTNVPEEPDPFYYDYATVQTVGMTLATIMFVLGIIIILSKKVKCRKADSRSERSGPRRVGVACGLVGVACGGVAGWWAWQAGRDWRAWRGRLVGGAGEGVAEGRGVCPH
ncbi:FXYD domain-containing ion transport regulator 7 [Marmota marmota marmota]|uniref:FXYD domain-containing ion transport regulator 7 n=1 Tax=Marmota marmota marmota TaxID=9994 RepID=UPI00076227B9|nr:FXYD domain-containing ion transport regulator 7 [Marmota marmota marmota]